MKGARTISLSTILALSIGLSCRTLAQAAQTEQKPVTAVSGHLTTEAREDLEKKLRVDFGDADASIAIDLGDLPGQWAYIHGKVSSPTVLGRIGRLWRLRLDHKAGAYILSRQDSLNDLDADAGVIAWLSNLAHANPSQFQQLLHGGLNLDDADQDGQDLLGSRLGINPDVVQATMSGAPTYASLGVAPILVKPGTSEEPNLAKGWIPIEVVPLGGKQHRAAGTRQTIVPYEPSEDGALDFGLGRVMRLAELVELSGEKLDFDGRVDPRAIDTLTFVKGRFSTKRMVAALRELGGSPILRLGAHVERSRYDAMRHELFEQILDSFRDSDPERTAYLQKLLDGGEGSIDANGLKLFGVNVPTGTPGGTQVGLGFLVTVGSDTRSFTDNGRTIPVGQENTQLIRGP